MVRAPVIALSHGGGPMPVLGDPSHSDLVESMRTKVPAILGLNDTERRPKAIILVTAHWSENVPSISSGAKPKLLYDYGGFPPEAYRLKYDAPGSPEIAQRVSELLSAKGFKPDLDDERGWDHGVFVPMLLVHPAADIPVIQVSVLASEDPAAHFKMGQALAPLRDENIAIIGSGFASFHNLRLMFAGITRDPAAAAQLKEWNAAVTAAATEADEKSRLTAFEQWRNFPAAYITHPRGGAEHFLPLIVCAGAVGNEKGKTFTDRFQGLDILSYYWE
ncbi:hypothetical protein Sste5346_008323 [Sporothrix stenoceras]|uniref:Extradiol ring-cleavage dioxygenase class III enzyme subunit B domain-containing protein n=1 Tax=Sporothrix stenoceras TaxID=5173 RepID=A0ABR3YQZ9_9PEZI